MNAYVANITDLQGEETQRVFEQCFDISLSRASEMLKKINGYLADFRQNLFVVIETDYVDKVYRDSFYHYFVTKLNPPKRECIKISFFDREIRTNSFFKLEQVDRLRGSYLGFMVIRPLPDSPVGRSVISPRALKEERMGIRVRKAEIDSTVMGLKMSVCGFPHSSQDGETMSCAETTLWALLEYFGNQYPEYKPVLLSHILKVLENQSHVRQTPSRGLYSRDISYALKSLGFGVVSYSRESYDGGAEFKRLFSTYVESGIPIIALIDGAKSKFRHAALCIGRVDITGDMVLNMQPLYDFSQDIAGKRENVIRWNDHIADFVLMDDNAAPYKRVSFEHPTRHYKDGDYSDGEINHFIVPLYSKVYLTAENAMKQMELWAANKKLEIEKDSVLRTFLTSGRSYKDYVMLNPTIDSSLRGFILQKAMPKFVWVTEISSKADLSLDEPRIHGAIVLDATEVRDLNSASFIFAFYKGGGFMKIDKPEEEVDHSKDNSKNEIDKFCKLKRFALSLQLAYSPFEGNLEPAENLKRNHGTE